MFARSRRQLDLEADAFLAPRKVPAMMIAAIAVIAAFALFFVAAGIETASIRLFQASAYELEWISDLVLATFFGLAVFFWLNLRQSRATISDLERRRIVIDTQLSLAARIQRELLPSLPADEDALRWGARLEPAYEVGGDLYDFVRGGDCWLVLVGDVAGKGVPAALVMSSIRANFRVITLETRDPAAIAERLSQSVYADHHGMPYFTCVILRVDLRAREIVYVNAGHPDAILLPYAAAERARFLASTALPVGLFAGQHFETHSVPLERGTAVVIVTDGVTDVLCASGTPWTEAAALVASEIPRPLMASMICDALIERTSSSGQDLLDDRTVVAMVFN